MLRSLILDFSVSEFLCQLRKPQRLEVSRILKQLADASDLSGTTTSRDLTDRFIQHRTINHWRISYWEDAPMNELRVLNIERDS